VTDMILTLARHPQARRLLSALPLPLPLPEPLRRATGPLSRTPLTGRRVLLSSDTPLESALAAAVHASGGERVKSAESQVHALVFDATSLRTPAELLQLHSFFHPRLRMLARHGRVLVIARPKDEPVAVAEVATRFALEGFVRSLAKELGRRAATAQLLEVAQGAEAQLPHALRFLLSARSAFVSGQRLGLTAHEQSQASNSDSGSGFAGRRALVTGAARGIGLVIAERLAQEGAQLTLLDRPAEQDTLAAQAQRLGADIILCDLAQGDAADVVLEASGEGFDVLIHNAGVTRDRTLGRMPEEAFRMAIDVNLEAPRKITERLLAAHKLGADARVVLLSSVAGIAGNVGQTNYAASKAGLLGLVRAWGRELEGRGVTVNALAPGFIETQMTAAMPWAIRQGARRLSALGQGGLPQDVAEAALFFASSHAGGLQSQVLRVCGGALVGA